MTVPRKIQWFNPGPKIYWRGRWFDKAMVTAIVAMERGQRYKEYFYQGSFNRGVSASAGTHNGGGVYDAKSTGLDNRKRKSRVGIVEWPRTRRQGFSPHGHAMLLGAKTASRGLKSQMYSWVRGRNGLANNRADDSGVRATFRSYPDWRKSLKKKTAAAGGKPKALPTSYYGGIEKSRKYGTKVRPYYSVKLLQRALNKIYKGTPLKEDGVYGAKTAALYNKWRRANFGAGSQSTGAVGPTGLKLLFKRAGMKVNVKK